MQELSIQQLDDVNGAGVAEAIGYFVGYAIGAMSKSVGEMDLQGGLALGA